MYTQAVTEKGSKNLCILIPGSRGGVEHPLLQAISKTLREKGHSFVGFDFTYYQNGDEVSPGFGLEIRDLHTVYQEVLEMYPDKKIHLIGKSLGGIVASRFVDAYEVKDIESISILGYVPGQINFGSYSGPVHVIQGADDKFGNLERVKEDLKQFKVTAKLKEIPCADHSFNCTKEKEKNHINDVTKHLSRIY